MMALELIITFGLVILIWIIQILHYPSFHFIQIDSYAEFTKFHGSRITMIVMPLMLLEILLASFSFYKTADIERFLLLLIVLLIWGSTFFIQVPCHNQLVSGYDKKIVDRLIDTNWIRTILWSLKFIWLAWKFRWQIG